MTVLEILQVAAWSLAAFSLACGSALIAGKAAGIAAARAEHSLKARLHRLLIHSLQSESEPAVDLGELSRHPRSAAEALQGVLGLVRGVEGDRMLASLQAAGLHRIFVVQTRSRSRRVRTTCVEALAHFRNSDVTAALRESLYDPCADTRLAAAASLADSDRLVTTSWLLDALRHGHLALSGRFLELVSRTVERHPEQGRATLARSDLDDTLRAVIVRALGDAGDLQALALICEESTSSRSVVRLAAVRALGHLPHPRVGAALDARLDDEDVHVRAAAVAAVGSAGITSLGSRLAEKLSDPDQSVRCEAQRAMRALNISPPRHEPRPPVSLAAA